MSTRKAAGAKKKNSGGAENWIHFRCSTQLTEALDAAAAEQGVSRSELARVVLETTLGTGTLAEIGARQGLFHFHGALRRAISAVTPEVAKLIETRLASELAEIEEVGDGLLPNAAQTRDRVERRVRREHENPKRLLEPMHHDDTDTGIDEGPEGEFERVLPPGFGPG